MFTMGDAPSGSDSDSNEVGMQITSDPDRTEIEQPQTAGAREGPSLPFRLLLVSDLVPTSPPEDWSSGEHVRQVDPHCFAEFMAEKAPELTLEVPNTLSETPETWTVDLSFPALDAFEPEQIARQAAPTARLVEVRDLVRDVGDGTIGLDTFQTQLDELGVEMGWADDLYQTLTSADQPDATGSSTDAGEESLDRLMGMVDVEENGEGSSPQEAAGSPDSDLASDAVDALMEAVRGDDPETTVDASAADRLVENLNEAVRGQIAPLIQHEKVRRLEAAWQGLKFLVDRLNFRDDVELTVLPAGREDLHEAMHHQVLVPEHNDETEEPPTSLILVDQAFGREHVDIERLTDLAETGKSLQTPVVASVNSAFFGIEKVSGLRKLPALRPHLQGDEYVEWERLRSDDASQFLGLALPSFLLRGAYDENASGNSLAVQEESGIRGSGALAVGVTAAESFVDSGWSTHLEEYWIDALPVESGDGGTSPLATLLPGSMQSQLARAGFIVLGGRANRDALRVTQASMVHDPGAFDDPDAAAEARAEASLPCRLFVARAAHHLLEVEKRLDLSASLTEIREEVAAAMASFMNVPVPEEASEDETDAEVGEQPVSVEHVSDVEVPNQEVLAVRLRPPDAILTSNVRLAMALRVPSTA